MNIRKKLKSKLNKKGYLDVNNTLSYNTDWIMQIGGRSTGKTYGWLEKILEGWLKKERPSVICRRLAKTIENQAIGKIFDEHIKNGWDKKLNCDKIVYKKHAFYLAYKIGNGKYELSEKPFCYVVALSTAESEKSTFPDLDILYFLFDEFLTREGYYLKNEFVLLMNLISTCKRKVTDCRIILCANSVSWSCPYFREFGLYHIKDLEKGTIQIYDFKNEDGLTTSMLVEYTENAKYQNKDKSDRYFAFDNPSLRMITSGEWEIPMYRHLTDTHYKDTKLVNRDVYFCNGLDYVCLEFRTGEVIGDFIYARPYTVTKKCPLDDRFIRLYTDNYDTTDKRYRSSMIGDNLDKIIKKLYKLDKIYYADNTCGEIVRNVMQYMGEFVA